ncbi:hypothetical protein BRD00_14925 [Halobacteriales archaeon QS_8_69_26]|nr:MAG: hypothetical protein BRD00_14925 [Halobacteriales archaeon QS_8_69_26]
MTPVADLDAVVDHCTFGPERVYVLMAIARPKENEDLTHGSAPVIREVVEDAEDLRRTVDQLDHAVSRFDATYRLYCSVNARDVTRAFFELRRSTDEWLEMRLGGNEEVLGKFRRIDSEFKSVLQRDTCRDDTDFLFDLDDATEADLAALRETLAGFTEVHLTRTTPSGYHVVTDPFDYNELDTDVAYELKTDGMLFLSYVGE